MSKSKKPILIAIFAVYCAALAYLTLLKGIGATFDMTYAEYIKANSNVIPFFSFMFSSRRRISPRSLSNILS